MAFKGVVAKNELNFFLNRTIKIMDKYTNGNPMSSKVIYLPINKFNI